jgi:hypothetical protein
VDRPFPKDLTSSMDHLNSELKSMLETTTKSPLLVQSIEKEGCLSKCLIIGKEPYSEAMSKDTERRKGLVARSKKLQAMFNHAEKNIKEVVRIMYWGKYKKEKKKEIFEKDDRLASKDIENINYHLPWEFCIYPLSTPLLFKSCLAAQFLFKAVF